MREGVELVRHRSELSDIWLGQSKQSILISSPEPVRNKVSFENVAERRKVDERPFLKVPGAGVPIHIRGTRGLRRRLIPFQVFDKAAHEQQLRLEAMTDDRTHQILTQPLPRRLCVFGLAKRR